MYHAGTLALDRVNRLERLSNWAWNAKAAEEFCQQVVDGQPCGVPIKKCSPVEGLYLCAAHWTEHRGRQRLRHSLTSPRIVLQPNNVV